MKVTRANCHLVSAGDIVRLGAQRRLVVYVAETVISFVRFRSSWCWNVEQRNATVVYSYPIKIEVIQRATDETRMLAERFDAWQVLDVPKAAWDRVCELSVAAIKCAC